MDCIFCRIVSGEIPADVVYQDDELVAFRDIHPQAPVHLLVIPRVHITSLNDLQEAHEALVGRIVLLAVRLARKEGVADSGYRLAINCGADAGQAVPHLHAHVLGGRALDLAMC